MTWLQQTLIQFLFLHVISRAWVWFLNAEPKVNSEDCYMCFNKNIYIYIYIFIWLITHQRKVLWIYIFKRALINLISLVLNVFWINDHYEIWILLPLINRIHLNCALLNILSIFLCFIFPFPPSLPINFQSLLCSWNKSFLINFRQYVLMFVVVILLN